MFKFIIKTENVDGVVITREFYAYIEKVCK